VSIITVRINGMEYNLRGEENDEYLQMVAQYVDNKINSLMFKNSKISRPDATILAAINLGDEVFKNKEVCERANENYKMISKEQKNLISEVEGLKRDLQAAKKENEDLRKVSTTDKDEEIGKLKDEVTYLKEQLELMDQVVQELKKDNNKQMTFNKKLLSENNNLRYQQIARVRQLEQLSHEIEDKNLKLMKSGQVNIIKK
jgi:cell division protein ZapA